MANSEAVEVILELRDNVARALRRHHPSADARALTAAIDELGIELAPVLPDAVDPALEARYRFEAPDLETAQAIVQRLRETGAVEAAYPKPRASLP